VGFITPASTPRLPPALHLAAAFGTGPQSGVEMLLHQHTGIHQKHEQSQETRGKALTPQGIV